jgi:hypothetical protein
MSYPLPLSSSRRCPAARPGASGPRPDDCSRFLGSAPHAILPSTLSEPANADPDPGLHLRLGRLRHWPWRLCGRTPDCLAFWPDPWATDGGGGGDTGGRPLLVPPLLRALRLAPPPPEPARRPLVLAGWEVLRELHATPLGGGHFGRDKTLSLARRSVWWPGADVQAYVQSCQTRQRGKADHLRPAGLLFPLPVPTRRGGCISLDFLELQPARSGLNFLQVHIDLLAGRVWLVPTFKTATTATAAR